MVRSGILRGFFVLLVTLPVTMANSFVDTPGGDVTGSAALEWILESEPGSDDAVGFTYNGVDVLRYIPYTGVIPPSVLEGPEANSQNISVSYDSRFTIYNTTTRGIGFRLTGLTPEDAGTYMCTYETLTAPITMDAVLFVYDVPGRPVIEVSPQILVEGVIHVSLQCGASSTSLPVTHRPAMLYTWSRNGVDINRTAPPGRHTLLGSSGQILEMSPVHHTDTTYMCTASESGTILVSEKTEVTLDVLYGPYNLTINPRNPSASQDEFLEITASADCNPNCSFTWSIGDDVISQGPILKFDRFQCRDAHKYTVRAENAYRTADLTVEVTLATVHGNHPYNITIHPRKPSAKEGDSFGIMASADCNPACSFTWSRDSDVISRGSLLIFDKFQSGDVNNYTVRAENIFGTADLTVDVTLDKNLGKAAGAQEENRVKAEVPAVSCGADDVIIGVVSAVACVSLIMNVVFVTVAFRRGLFSCHKGDLEPGNTAAIYVNGLVREPGKPATNYVNGDMIRIQGRSAGIHNQKPDVTCEVVTPTLGEPTETVAMAGEDGLDKVSMASGGHPVVAGVYEPVDQRTREPARPADKVYAALGVSS